MMRRAALVLLFAAISAQAEAVSQEPGRLEVDATDAPRRLIHIRLSQPAAPGPLTLLYPQWIPGEHGPTGPIADLVNLRFTAGGQTVAWRRDSVDLFAFHLNLPAGRKSLDAS